MSDRCDRDVFKNGTPLLAATTGPVGGAALFETWVQRVAKDSGQCVDWHYSGGIAQVLVLGDVDAALRAAVALRNGLPANCEIIRWLVGEPGLYRLGVSDKPTNALGATFDPATGGTEFI